MKKQLLSLIYIILLITITHSAFANSLSKSISKPSYSSFIQPAGKSKMLKNAGYSPTSIYIINNTQDTISVDIPGTSIHDIIPGNNVDHITSIWGGYTEIRLWHPLYGYFYDYNVWNHAIVSFSIQYGVAVTNAVTFEA